MNNNIEPSRELLVFKKREIFLLISLLALVAMFSFTLGVKLGKTLVKVDKEEHAKNDEHDSNSLKLESKENEKEVSQTQNHNTAHKESLEESNHNEHETSHSDDAYTTIQNPHEVSAKKEHTEHIGEKVVGSEMESKEARTEEKKNVKSEKSQKISTKPLDSLLEEELKTSEVNLGKKIPTAYPKEKKASLVASGKYTLQVGSHHTQAEADSQVKELKAQGFDAFMLEADLGEKGVWYRVGIGIFKTKEMAEKTAMQWKRTKKLPPFIIQKLE
jgi:cell division protein FtsN